MIGESSLHLLSRLKWRGMARKQWRRMRTPRGLMLAGLGVLLIVFWFFSLVAWSFFGNDAPSSAEELRPILRGGTLGFTVLTLIGAFHHRGLYLPAEEIERLFSAPVSRADITRYRLRAILARTSFGALVLGFLVMSHTPVAAYGFLAAACFVGLVGVLGQAFSVIAGAFEARFLRRTMFLPNLLVTLAVLVVGAIVFWNVLVTARGPGHAPVFLERIPNFDTIHAFLDRPWVRACALPFEPWTRAATATSAGTFVPWFGLSCLLAALVYEATARLPVDYRELSLETSASVAAKLRRLRRVGGGASASRVSSRTRGWRTPFLFGRGPGGALAWRKTVEMVRKARGTLWISTLVLVLIFLLSGSMGGGEPGLELLNQTLLIALLGTVYLCSGLRFDFRDDLDRMVVIKSWPLSPRRIFVATILPEVFLVMGLLLAATTTRILLADEFHPGIWMVLLSLPPVVFAWLALDNAVFLYAPIRFVPGQEGALQNAGRMILLVFLRMVIVAALSIGIGLLAGGSYYAASVWGGWSDSAAVWSAAAAGWLALVVFDVLLVFAGGQLVARFDVTRDRG